MKSDDFAAWLSAISRMSEGQRAAGLAALEKAGLAGAAEAEVSGKKAGKRGRREDALGTTGVARVAAQGCPHCAGREMVGWGRSHGLLRYRCKSCGRTFNTLTKTPMAHLRKKEKWLDHARAMIEGKSLAKTAALCGVHPTTAFRWRHRFLRAPAVNKPRSLRGIVEADETFILESFKGRWSDLPRAARKRGGTARHAGLYQDNIPILVARDRKGATFDAVLPQVDGASVGAALAGVVTPGNHLIGDGGKAIAAFARKAGIPFHAVPAPGKPAPEAPHLHINNVNAYHGRLKQWLSRFNGVATKNLPNYLGWRRALEAWGDKLDPPNWIVSAIGNGPYQHITL
jgi:transposase-like protein